MPAGTTRDNFDFPRLIHEAAGAEFDVEFQHIGFWDLRFAVADSYGEGRMFIAGDAAHSHPPYGGYGVNLGLEDARNLGWKLAAVLQGWGGARLLASYDAERRPVFQSTARDFIERASSKIASSWRPSIPRGIGRHSSRPGQQRSSGASSEVHAFEPQLRGLAGGVGTRPAAVAARGARTASSRRPGHHLAPQPLSTGRNVFEELGDGFTLLALDGTDAAVADFADAAERLRVPLKVLRDTRANGRERYEASYVLVRPDQFVAWAGSEGRPDAVGVLSKAIGAG